MQRRPELQAWVFGFYYLIIDVAIVMVHGLNVPIVFSTDIDNFGTTAAKLEYQDRYNLLLHFAYSVALSGRGTIICGTFYAVGCPKM